MTLLTVFRDGWLFYKGRRYRAALGRSGIRRHKREGDGATPTGLFALRKIYYRADKSKKPPASLPAHTILQRDGWCDAPRHPRYNQHIRRPFRYSHECLWRDDELYDLCIPLGFNDSPARAYGGSAIFLHVARENYAPTEGCVALQHADLLTILRRLAPCDAMLIVDRCYFGRAPKIAVPTRTDVAPKAMAVS